MVLCCFVSACPVLSCLPRFVGEDRDCCCPGIGRAGRETPVGDVAIGDVGGGVVAGAVAGVDVAAAGSDSVADCLLFV